MAIKIFHIGLFRSDLSILYSLINEHACLLARAKMFRRLFEYYFEGTPFNLRPLFAYIAVKRPVRAQILRHQILQQSRHTSNFAILHPTIQLDGYANDCLQMFFAICTKRSAWTLIPCAYLSGHFRSPFGCLWVQFTVKSVWKTRKCRVHHRALFNYGLPKI